VPKENQERRTGQLIVIDYQDRRPLYEQIVEKFKMLIVRGVLEADSQMPSVRALATQLSINPNTIQRAYAELERQGFIYPVKGRGNFVSPNLRVVEERMREYRQRLSALLKEGAEMGLDCAQIQAMTEELWREQT
jgi:GntR family transcriptional regulator